MSSKVGRVVGTSRLRIAVAMALAIGASVAGVSISSVGAATTVVVTTTDVPAPLYPYNSPAVGDVTGDGLDDVVHPVLIGSGPSLYSVAVFAGRADGTLDAGVVTADIDGASVSELSVGDMDGDGRADLVHFEREVCPQPCVSGPPDYQLTVRPGRSDGTFGDPKVVATQQFSSGIELADLNADGRLDIASQAEVGGQTPTGWWANNVNGTFGPFESFNAPYGSVDGVGQFGGGTATDVLIRVDGVSATSWVSVLDPGLSSPSQVTTNLGSYGNTWSIADIDGDGDDDVLYLQFGNQWRFMLRLSNGDGSFGPAVHVADYVGESNAVLADVDGSGHHDIVFFNASNGVNVIDPEGVEPPSEVVSVGVRLVQNAVVGDFDGAGTDDVVRYSYGYSAGLPDAFKTFRFEAPNPDADGDGVVDAIGGGTPGSFNDGSGTVGQIVTVPAGLTVAVSDAPDAGDGVRVVVGGTGIEKVTLSVCGGFTLKLSAGSDVVITCGSVTVKVAAGSVDVELASGLAAVTIPAGAEVKIDTASSGGFSVNVLSVLQANPVIITVDGVVSSIEAAGITTVRAWDFVGFDRPVDGGGAMNSVKAGRAVPLKWRLLDATGAPVLDLATAGVTFLRTSCSGGSVETVEATSTVGSGLQNLGNGWYQLNWKTPKAKGCGIVQLDIGDGVLHTAKFQLN